MKPRREKAPAPKVTLNVGILRSLKLPAPLSEYKFHETRDWRLDFAWPECRLAVEIEGGIWRGYGRKEKAGGAHSHPLNILRDIQKYNALAMQRWYLLRFTTDQVRSGECYAVLQEFFRMEMLGMPFIKQGGRP